MIKRMSMLATVGLLFMVTTETESQAQGFGGYHRADANVRNVNVARGVNVGVRGGAYRPYGYGYRGAGLGAYGALPNGAYGGYGGNVYLPPKPGKGPVDVAWTGKGNSQGDDLRGSSEAALNQALNQMKLPSDAGMPASSAGSKKK